MKKATRISITLVEKTQLRQKNVIKQGKQTNDCEKFICDCVLKK